MSAGEFNIAGNKYRKRALGLRMVKRLHDGLKIPYESLSSHAIGLAGERGYPKQKRLDLLHAT